MDLRAGFGARRHRGFFLVAYVLFVSGVWMLASIPFGPVLTGMRFEVTFLWALATGLTTVGVLDLINFFDPIHLLPRKRDLATLCLVLPLPGMFWKLVFHGFTGITIVRYSEILLVTPLVALTAYAFHVAARAVERRRRGTYRLVAALTPAELDRVRRSLARLPHPERVQVEGWKPEQPPASLEDFHGIVYSRQILRDLRADTPLIEGIFRGVPAVEFRRFLMVLDYKADLALLDTWYFLQILRERDLAQRFYEGAKLVAEPVAAFVMIIVLSPLLLLTAFAVKLSSPGPALYRQERAGREGRVFRLLKFRTMVDGAEKSGPQWSTADDPRITRLGRFLRRTRLDELPQLFNILTGELGFVGPRPERPEIVKRLEADLPFFSLRNIVRPGVTGWAQVQYGYVATVEESKLKLEYDLFYIVHQSVWLDLAILLKTAALFLRRGGGTGR